MCRGGAEREELGGDCVHAAVRVRAQGDARRCAQPSKPHHHSSPPLCASRVKYDTPREHEEELVCVSLAVPSEWPHGWMRLQQPPSRPSRSAACSHQATLPCVHIPPPESHTLANTALYETGRSSPSREENVKSGAGAGVSESKRPNRVLSNSIRYPHSLTHSLTMHSTQTHQHHRRSSAAPAQPASRRRCCGARAAACRRPRRTC